MYTYFVRDGLINGVEGRVAAEAVLGDPQVDGWYYIFDGMDDGAGPYPTQHEAARAGAVSVVTEMYHIHSAGNEVSYTAIVVLPDDTWAYYVRTRGYKVPLLGIQVPKVAPSARAGWPTLTGVLGTALAIWPHHLVETREWCPPPGS